MPEKTTSIQKFEVKNRQKEENLELLVWVCLYDHNLLSGSNSALVQVL